MTKQDERNKRFDEKFAAMKVSRLEGEYIYTSPNSIKAHLNSEVDLAIAEERKRIVEVLRGHLFSVIDFALYKGKYSQLDIDDRESFSKDEAEKLLSLINKDN